MKKRKRTILTPEERQRFAETMRLLEERAAYHDRKRAEREAAARGDDQA